MLFLSQALCQPDVLCVADGAHPCTGAVVGMPPTSRPRYDTPLKVIDGVPVVNQRTTDVLHKLQLGHPLHEDQSYRPAGPGAAGCGVGVALRHGCIRREGASEAAPEVVGQAVGGGCQSGWGRLLSVLNAIEADTWRQGDSGWA